MNEFSVHKTNLNNSSSFLTSKKKKTYIDLKWTCKLSYCKLKRDLIEKKSNRTLQILNIILYIFQKGKYSSFKKKLN